MVSFFVCDDGGVGVLIPSRKVGAVTGAVIQLVTARDVWFYSYS